MPHLAAAAAAGAAPATASAAAVAAASAGAAAAASTAAAAGAVPRLRPGVLLQHPATLPSRRHCMPTGTLTLTSTLTTNTNPNPTYRYRLPQSMCSSCIFRDCPLKVADASPHFLSASSKPRWAPLVKPTRTQSAHG